MVGGAAAPERLRSLPPHRRRVPPPRGRAARAQRLGEQPPAVAHPERARGRRRLRARACRLRWAGNVPPRPARARPSGPRRPARAGARSARRPRLRAARVRRARRRRRGRDGRGDRVAERARGRIRGRIGAPPRAGAPAAERGPPALLQARARRIPGGAARSARRAPPLLRSALVSARALVGRTAGARGARGSLPRRARAERRRAGDQRHRLPPRLRARSAPAGSRRGARPRHGRALDRARERLDGSGADRRIPDARAGGRLGAVGIPGRRHARRDEVRRASVCTEGRGDVVHAERPDRDAARRGGRALRRRGRARAALRRVVAAPARRGDDRRRARARRDGLPPPAPVPAWLGRAAARSRSSSG